MAPADDHDSGMESQEGSQSVDPEVEKEASPGPEPSAKKQSAIQSAEDAEELVETLSERLWGLTEMFPERVRKATNTTVAATKTGLCQAYGLSRNVAWIVFSTSIILFAPVIFEVERANMEEMQRNQQKQMLLGPNSAISGGVPPPLLPPVQR